MPAIEREGDPNSAGGTVIQANQGTVYANNIKVAVDGSPVSGHGKGVHSHPITSGGSSTVFIDNKPVNRIGDSDTCGHPRVAGSPNVFVN